MKKWIFVAGLALSLSALAQNSAPIVFHEDFSTDPVGRWNAFGDSSLFHWNSSNKELQVTWDSSKPKSLFYIPLSRTITRADSFQFEFDLQLEDISSGHETGKNGPMQIGIGFLNIAATNLDWSRVEWPLAADVAEFNTYPSGLYPGWPVLATTSPAFVSSSGFSYAPMSLDEYIMDFPLGQSVHVKLQFDAANQTLTSTWSTNGVLVGSVHRLVLTNSAGSQFSASDDFRVNIFSISSYKSNEGSYANSVLAHGSVDNISINIPTPPDRSRILAAGAEGSRAILVHTLPGRTYALERTSDLNTWETVQGEIAGTGAAIVITDPASTSGNAFYRVRSTQ